MLNVNLHFFEMLCINKLVGKPDLISDHFSIKQSKESLDLQL